MYDFYSFHSFIQRPDSYRCLVSVCFVSDFFVELFREMKVAMFHLTLPPKKKLRKIRYKKDWIEAQLLVSLAAFVTAIGGPDGSLLS